MIFASVTGRLGKDAELKFTANGTQFLSFSVASDAGYGDNKHTNWVNCTIWGNRAEKVAEYLTKGTQITAHGEMDLRKWESDGRSGSSLELKVAEFVFAGGKQEETKPAQGYRETNTAAPVQEPAFADDDIPF